MALATRFEDLQVWQEARRLTQQVYRIGAVLALRRDFGLLDQIRRAAVSTMNNVAEGFDSASRIEFVRFLRYAARSASEVQSCLYVCLDQQYVSDSEFRALYDQAERIRRMSRALAERLVARRARRGQVDRLRDPEGVWLDDWMPIWTEGAVHRAEITPGAGVEGGPYAHTRTRAHAHTK